jgi:hypothetical protein
VVTATPTPIPSLSFATTTAVPAPRKTVVPAKVGSVSLRNFDAQKTDMTGVIEALFVQLAAEFQKVCSLRRHSVCIRTLTAGRCFSRACICQGCL